MKKQQIILLVSVVLLTVSCVSTDRVRGNILQPTDRVLPSYQDNLVIVDVRIASEGSPMKLREMWLRHTTTGDSWRIALFGNALLKTQALPFDQRGDSIYHTIAVDLPAGSYQLQSLVLQNYVANLISTDVAQILNHTLTEPLFLEVASVSEPQYLGTLEMRINPYVVGQSRDLISTMLESAHEAQTSGNTNMDGGGTDAVLGAAAGATATDIQRMSGNVEITAVSPNEATTANVGKQFRALSGEPIVSSRMWTRSGSNQ